MKKTKKVSCRLSSNWSLQIKNNTIGIRTAIYNNYCLMKQTVNVIYYHCNETPKCLKKSQYKYKQKSYNPTERHPYQHGIKDAMP